MMNRSVGRYALGCLAVLVVATVGCGDPMPLVAVPGSSVVVPVTVDLGGVGFGGTELSEPDLQRGSLYFRLIDENDVLVADVQARVTGVVRASSRASLDWRGQGQVVSLFDIPASVAPGTYTLRTVNVRGSQETLVAESELEIAALAQSPTNAPQSELNQLMEALLPQVVPQPAVVLRVQSCQGCRIGALDLEVTYPHETIDLVDAVPGDALRKGLAWLDDDGEGTARIGAVTLDAGFGWFNSIGDSIWLVFELEEGQEPLTPQMIGVTVRSVADADGTPMSPESITVTAQAIF